MLLVDRNVAPGYCLPAEVFFQSSPRFLSEIPASIDIRCELLNCSPDLVNVLRSHKYTTVADDLLAPRTPSSDYRHSRRHRFQQTDREIFTGAVASPNLCLAAGKLNHAMAHQLFVVSFIAADVGRSARHLSDVGEGGSARLIWHASPLESST